MAQSVQTRPINPSSSVHTGNTGHHLSEHISERSGATPRAPEELHEQYSIVRIYILFQVSLGPVYTYRHL